MNRLYAAFYRHIYSFISCKSISYSVSIFTASCCTLGGAPTLAPISVKHEKPVTGVPLHSFFNCFNSSSMPLSPSTTRLEAHKAPKTTDGFCCIFVLRMSFATCSGAFEKLDGDESIRYIGQPSINGAVKASEVSSGVGTPPARIVKPP